MCAVEGAQSIFNRKVGDDRISAIKVQTAEERRAKVSIHGIRTDLELQFADLGSAMMFFEDLATVVDNAARDKTLSFSQKMKVG